MTSVVWDGVPPRFCGAAERLVRESLEALGLSREVRGVVLAPRDGRCGDDAWIRWTHARPARVWLDAEMGVFLSPARRREALRQGLRLRDLPRRCFSARAFREMLGHELAHVRDEILYGIRPDRAPAGRRQEFNELWNVWIDGRLQRWNWPAMSRQARWKYFQHTFSSRAADPRRAAALFDHLWNADRVSQEELLAALRELSGNGLGRPRRGRSFFLAARVPKR